MDKVIEILKAVHPEVDYENETGLIDKRIFDSFDVVTIVGELMDEFDIEISDDTCLSLSDLLHSAWQSLGPSMPLQMALFCSFSWLNNIQLCIYAISFLSIIPSLDI